MTHNKGVKRNGKKKVNPLHRQPQRAIRLRTNFDGQILNHKTIYSELTASSGNVAARYWCDASSGSGVLGTVGSAIAGNYSQFVYESVVFRWLPSVAPGVAAAGGRGFVAFYDSPEDMVIITGHTNSQMIGDAKGSRNMKSFNVWEPFVYNVPLTRRRKTFSVNLTNSGTAYEHDSSVQGLVVTGFETVGATDTVGRWQVESVVRLLRQNTVSAST
jgi:hypothetical protein